MSVVLSDYVLTPVSNAASATAGYVSGAAGKASDAVTGLFSSKAAPVVSESSKLKKALKFTVWFTLAAVLLVATVMSGGLALILLAKGAMLASFFIGFSAVMNGVATAGAYQEAQEAAREARKG
jgi:hypothetical protein